MASPKGDRRSQRRDVSAPETTPADFPQTTPPISAVDHSWVFQSTMDIQKAIGRMEQSVHSLETLTRDHGEKLARFEKVLYAVSVVFAGLVAVSAFIANKLWDPVVAALMEYAKTR